MLDTVRPARVPEKLFGVGGYFLPRLMFLNTRYAPQVHWGDIAVALDGFPEDLLDLGSALFWDEWRDRWERQGRRYEQLAAQSSTVAGRSRGHRGAAACYHWAEFMDFGDPARKLRLRRLVRDHFLRSVAGSDLELIPGEVPAPDAKHPAVSYWLLLPPAHRRPPGPLPTVLLCNGLDSMTEVEPLSLAEAFLERGFAAVLFDGPGQGINLGQQPLREDMERVVAGLLQQLRNQAFVDGGRMAFAGISYGGYIALRVAQALGREFRCVVNLSGGPSIAAFDQLPRRLRDDFRFAMSGGDSADMQARLDRLAIDPGVPPGTEVLSIHGGLDDIFPLAGLAGLDVAWRPRHELRTHPREAHACLNIINACSVEAADWVATRLNHR